MLATYDRLTRPGFLHICKIVPITRNLNTELLRESVRCMMRRHTILRARFNESNEIWTALMDEQLQLEFEEIDLSGQEAARGRALAKEAIARLTERRFEIRTGSMLRAGVVRLDSHRHLLVIVFHHAVSDGRSLEVALGEIAVTYDRLERGEALAFPDLPCDFFDVVKYRAQWLGSADGQWQLNYWKQFFSGVSSTFELPADAVETVLPDGTPELISGELSADETEALKRLALEEQTTLFTVVVTAFCVVLSQWGRRSEAYLWILHHGRWQPELRNLIGCFIDILALKADLSDARNFREALRAVHGFYVEAFARREVPSSEVARIIDAERGTHQRGTLFNYIPWAWPKSDRERTASPTDTSDDGAQKAFEALADLPLSRYLETANGTQLLITAYEGPNSVRWILQHDPLVFRDSTIAALSASALGLLQEVATGANPPIQHAPS